MKRQYSDLKISLLPVLDANDPRHFKSVLEGSYELQVVKVVDISKPTERPIDEIDEPETEEEAAEIRLNQNNARMIKLSLKDSNGTEISAIETERINELDNIQNKWKLFIEGPVEIRCDNMMLERKNVIGKEKSTDVEIHQSGPKNIDISDAEATQIIDLATEPPRENIKTKGVVVPGSRVLADWDEEDEEECIVID